DVGDIPFQIAIDSNDTLYVLEEGVAVFNYGASKPSYTIYYGLEVPISIGIDRQNDLFVGDHETKAVTAYAPGSNQPYETITQGINDPRVLAFEP
ncbi:MAG TPA: hypothetical protein VGF18_04415, partial [Candidatus Tumulicola sp.]